MKLDRLVILVALVTAAMGVVTSLSVPEEMQLTRIVRDSTVLTFLSIWTLASLPLAFAMPRLRVSFFGRIGRTWRLPSETYLLPRWIVRLVLGSLLGQVAAALVLAILQDPRIFWFAGSSALLSAAFSAGAWRRLKKYPRTEFNMPFSMFWWLRR